MNKKPVKPSTHADSDPQPDAPVALTPAPSGYADWLADLKSSIHTAQQRAALAVNREDGRDILERQAQQDGARWLMPILIHCCGDRRCPFHYNV